MENSNKSVGIGRVEITSALVRLVAGMIFPPFCVADYDYDLAVKAKSQLTCVTRLNCFLGQLGVVLASCIGS